MKYSLNLEQLRPLGFTSHIRESEDATVKNVQKNSGFKNVELCPVCQEKDFKFEFIAYGIDIVCCNNCKVRYTRKIAKNLHDVYSTKMALESYSDSYLNNEEYRVERFAKERLSIIIELFPKKNMKILDYGCGTGWFLKYVLSENINADGYEFSKNLAAFTSQRTSANIYSGDLSKVNTKYDVITLFDVIEHVESPCIFLKSLSRLLKNNGYLVIFTPNFDSVSIKHLREKHNLIIPTRHLTYFNHESMAYVANKAGYNFFSYKTKGIDIGDLHAFYNDKMNDNILIEYSQYLSDALQPMIDANNAGNHMRVIMQKMLG